MEEHGRPPVDITYAIDAFKPEYNWQVLAPGPGHSIQLKNGRLLVPVWICEPAKLLPHKSHYPSRVATIYSDDTGRNLEAGRYTARPAGGERTPASTWRFSWKMDG